jgi:hypothetical protein
MSAVPLMPVRRLETRHCQSHGMSLETGVAMTTATRSSRSLEREAWGFVGVRVGEPRTLISDWRWDPHLRGRPP